MPPGSVCLDATVRKQSPDGGPALDYSTVHAPHVPGRIVAQLDHRPRAGHLPPHVLLPEDQAGPSCPYLGQYGPWCILLKEPDRHLLGGHYRIGIVKSVLVRPRSGSTELNDVAVLDPRWLHKCLAVRA
jgi:hypothetical protein